MITPEPPAGSEHYREGWRHGYEQAAIDRERSADAVRPVPDTAQVGRCGNAPRYQPKNLALHSSCTLPHGHAGWHRDNGTGAEWGQMWTDPDTGQADEVLKLRWEVQQLQGIVQDQHRGIAAVRSLCADAMKLPTLEDPRPADDRVSPRAVLAALDRAEAVPDTGQPPDADDLAYARSEVDKWLTDNDPYCILPTRTEHIPALLARLDELEGTR